MSRGSDPLSAMVRGFGYAVGRRAAYRLPLWAGILVVVAWHFLRSS